MKIMLISPMPPYRGGIAAFGQALLDHLSPKHTVKATSFSRLYPSIFFPGTSQLQVGMDFHDNPQVDFSIDAINPLSWRRTAKIINSHSPDVCIFAYWHPAFIPAYRGIMRKLNKGVRCLLLCHNVQEHESIPGLGILKRKFMASADGLIVLASAGEAIVKSMGISTPVKRLFHPLYDHYGDASDQGIARSALGIGQDTPTLLFFGLVRPYKGLPILLEAAGALVRAKFHFHLRVAGEFYGGYDEAVKQVQVHGLGNHVTLENRFIPDDEVGTYFSAADGVVLPYLTATQSGVGPIAYHFNRPVIVSDAGGLPETVIEGETGFVTPAGDGAALAKLLMEKLGTELPQMPPKVERAKARWSWDQFVTDLEDVL